MCAIYILCAIYYLVRHVNYLKVSVVKFNIYKNEINIYDDDCASVQCPQFTQRQQKIPNND